MKAPTPWDIGTKVSSGSHATTKEATLTTSVYRGHQTQHSKDLSIIAESEKTPIRSAAGHQVQQESRKTYLSLTVTAAARKEAIQGANSHLQ